MSNTENKLEKGDGSDASTCSAVCGKCAYFKKLKSYSGAEASFVCLLPAESGHEFVYEAFENGLCELFTSNVKEH